MRQCVEVSSVPIIANADIYEWEHWEQGLAASGADTCMVARGALFKPWLFTEIDRRSRWDISSAERMDMLRRFVGHGLEHWGSDRPGVERTRRFLLEWLSFLWRYVPVGLLERVPTQMHLKPYAFRGRDDLETLMASPKTSDWIRISEMLLGPAPKDMRFVPKHISNAWQASDKSGPSPQGVRA